MMFPRSCLICHILIYSESALCGPCASELWNCRRPTLRRHREYLVRSLFAWDQKSPPAVRWLAWALKRRHQARLWKEFAAWMIFENHGHPCQPWVIPVPSHGPNHALGLARAVSDVLEGQVADILTVTNDRAQKTLGRDLRQQVVFRRRAEICTDFRGVIVVDDIVTTGSTAAAAFSALGKPRNCEIWCLIDRRPCGSV